ncbi:diacylglycerol kinase [Enterococcus hermanniensis]|uniref:Diacylglycerol kinase n=1 Tax=Enterococcus hermanniensis TaxID=249189 RepID=A0A1L8TPA2_9ENTE|nr:diacylglycerol kinase [Enterococcus hermanniensis]
MQGIRTVFQEERNMRAHVVFGLMAILVAFLLRVSVLELLWIFLAVFLVWIVEIINTIFENVVDMVTDFHFHPIGKKIKDMAAGAVLVTSLFSAIVGAIIFLPKIIKLFL